jgi:hypothetical protein
LVDIGDPSGRDAQALRQEVVQAFRNEGYGPADGRQSMGWIDLQPVAEVPGHGLHRGPSLRPVDDGQADRDVAAELARLLDQRPRRLPVEAHDVRPV